ncbi:MAG: Tad domain-containing protein [Candidatus Firestonebacteria bacterium]
MKKQRGQVLVLVALAIPAIILLIAFTLAVGKLVYSKIRLQNSADGAAYTAALWQARGLNVISDLNWALLAAGGAETVSLRVDYKISKAIMKVQDGAKASFPGVAALAMYYNFKGNNGGGVCLPVVTGLQDAKMFSLRVKRYRLSEKLDTGGIIPSFMVKEQERFWVEQKKTGPLIRVICRNSAASPDFGEKLLHWKIPAQYALASAMPFRSGAESGEEESLGGLWLPHFYPKLIPFGIGLTKAVKALQ